MLTLFVVYLSENCLGAGRQGEYIDKDLTLNKSQLTHLGFFSRQKVKINRTNAKKK